MTYEILSILDGKETVLLKTTDKQRAQKEYYRTELCRLRINGKTLLIHEADKIMAMEGSTAWRFGYPMMKR